MVDAIAHRGPDRRGAWSEGPVALGQCTLSTLPESEREEQPLVDRRSDLVITADARVDNRLELIADIGVFGGAPSSITDSEIILAAYVKWGDDCVHHLVGDFAFAIWDGSREKLFCARDHFGVKPLNYYSSDALFAFSSESKALFALEDVPRLLDEVAVGDYLTSMYEDTERTFYSDIRRLPQAHYATIDRNGVRLHRYWSLDPDREIRLRSDKEYAEGFKELFYEAVRCRMRSTGPVGTLLSGGLDSSSITCVAREAVRESGRGGLHTFSALFDDVVETDERPFIESVLSQGSVHSRFLRGDRLSPLGDLERVQWHQDEPLTAFNLFLNRALYADARDQGVRVILDGFDGDSTVSHGMGYLVELADAGRWWRLITELYGLRLAFDHSPLKTFRGYFWRFGIGPKIPGPARATGAGLKRRLGRRAGRQGPPKTFRYVSADFASRVGLDERRIAQRRCRVSTERQEHFQTLTQGVMPHVLEVLDRAAASYSIEPRYPFWDRRLVEFCLALPAEQKLRKGWTRFVMRQGMQGVLPPDIQWRPRKANMGHNFDRAMRTFENDRIRQVIVEDASAIEGYVNVDALRGAYDRFAVGGSADGADVMAIWRAVTLALWLRSAKVEA